MVHMHKRLSGPAALIEPSRKAGLPYG
jgi:hypothetical protein